MRDLQSTTFLQQRHCFLVQQSPVLAERTNRDKGLYCQHIPNKLQLYPLKGIQNKFHKNILPQEQAATQHRRPKGFFEQEQEQHIRQN